jgi:hypothetical protein
MISYPKSKLHRKIICGNSMCECGCCEMVYSPISSDCDSRSFCCSDTSYINNYSNCCEEEIIENNCCKNNCCETTMEFSENCTKGILKIIKIKSDFSTGYLKIYFGNCINLKREIFDGMLTLSIMNDTNNDIYINNHNKKIVIKSNNYVLLKKCNCEWKLTASYKIKCKKEKSCYKKNKECCCEKKSGKFYDSNNIIYENKKYMKSNDDESIEIFSISSDESELSHKKKKSCNCNN